MAKWRLHPDCIRRQWNSSLLLSHWHYWVALLAPTSCTFQRMSPGQNVAKITSTRFRTADCLHNYCHSQLLQAALVIWHLSQVELLIPYVITVSRN